jgi:hypothetical protein
LRGVLFKKVIDFVGQIRTRTVPRGQAGPQSRSPAERKKLSQMASRTKPQVNGINAAGWEAFREEVQKDSSVADRRRIERSSPVGDSLGRSIPLTVEFSAN